MALRLLVVVFLASILVGALSAAPNYQQRRLYYNEQDNVCRHGQISDQIFVTITFKDRQMIDAYISGETYCNNWSIRYEYMVSAGSAMCYEECYDPYDPIKWRCDSLCFNLKPTYHRFLDRITAITSNATIEKLGKFDDHKYNCTMEGDGTVQHYGPIGTVPAPRIKVYCERIVEIEEEIA